MRFPARAQLARFFHWKIQNSAKSIGERGLHIFIKNRITKLLSYLYENNLKMKMTQQWGLLTLILLNLKVVNQ